jgi:hypothetical protein
VLRSSLHEAAEPDEVLTAEAASLLAAKLKTPLQIGQHLVRAFEAGFEMGVKPIDASIVEAVLSRQINDLEAQLTQVRIARETPIPMPQMSRTSPARRGSLSPAGFPGSPAPAHEAPLLDYGR